MSSFMVALVILATTVVTVALGIYAAHFSINTILFALTRQRRAQVVLVPTQNLVSGD